ncbi:hypothetical protein B7486_65655, partial [cyanobacterium TDX16]
MFYGGSVLTHLQAELNPEQQDPDLVDLWRINRNMVVVMDSDRDEESQPLKERVKRLQREIQSAGSDHALVWITTGRTIEDYVDPD